MNDGKELLEEATGPNGAQPQPQRTSKITLAAKLQELPILAMFALALCLCCLLLCTTPSSSLAATWPPTRTPAGPPAEGVRLNKCLQGLSRRAADAAIEEGRVSVNGKVVTSAGLRVGPRDTVKLDGQAQNWRELQSWREEMPSTVLEERNFVYVKYWKPVGVTCTSDPSDTSNIIAAGKFHLFPQRLVTVGRLDKDSTGLILLTSDGRVNNALLRRTMNKEKAYQVEMDKVPSEQQVQALADGVVITTKSQRKGAKEVTARTLPCRITRIGGPLSRRLEFVLVEGRNRQIRRMAEAVGLSVVRLHRVLFAGIGLRGLSEGNWCELDDREMTIVRSAIRSSLTTAPAAEDAQEDSLE